MGVLAGIYIGVGFCVFLYIGFMKLIKDKKSELWKPFLIAPFWIVTVPFMILCKRFFGDK